VGSLIPKAQHALHHCTDDQDLDDFAHHAGLVLLAGVGRVRRKRR
jgi:hypothetical protein